MGKKYEDVSNQILSGLNSFQSFYSREYYLDLEDRILTLKDKIKDSMKEGRLLKIGIVGEVKAGKSSFLNALIFDGKEVLPKASTPMTAALTKITYSEKPSATIVFYSIKDWERVESYSKEYDNKFQKYYNEYIDRINKKNPISKGEGKVHFSIKKTEKEMKGIFNRTAPIKLVSCKELTDMYKNSNIDLLKFLGQTIEINIEDIDESLKDYIGVDGQYTAIVKHVELKMNNEMLKNIEIVDTPGLNDPIISRGETTKQFLRECDVVFLLSYAGQFLTQEDIVFMCETLPNEGIRDIVIVCSKFDSGILDDNKSKNIRLACNSSKLTYDKQASENIKRCLTSNYNTEILHKIQESLPPSYISSILYSSGMKKKQGISYSENELNIINQLKEHFKDFEDDTKSLISLSGIIQLKKNKLNPIMQSKEQIIAERNRKMLSDNKRVILRLLEDIMIQALQNKDDLEHYDKGQLEEKLCLLQTKLNTMRREIRNIFENSSVEAAKFLNNMKVNIGLEIDNYIDFDVNTHVDVKHETVRTGFLGLRKEHYTKEVTTYSASVSDVISNMRRYINRCKKYTNEEFEKIINLNKLENTVKEVVIGAFDLSGKDFNENDILIPLEIVIKNIQIPKIDIEVIQFEDLIIDNFSGSSVQDDDIHKLRLLENKVLEDISKKIKEQLDICRNEIDSVMAKQSATFVDNIIKQLTVNIEMLRNQIDDKENAIRQYNILCNALNQYKEMVVEMEV